MDFKLDYTKMIFLDAEDLAEGGIQAAYKNLLPELLKEADEINEVLDDKAPSYSVRHRDHEYVRGDAYTNTVEGYYSIFKRGMKGVYQHCSEKHLHRYLAEFDFRYNNRAALGVDDKSRAETLARGIVGKRLTYRRPHSTDIPF